MKACIPTPRRVSLRRWAQHNDIPYATARALAARAIDPIPHVRLSPRRILVDVDAAEEWLKRQDTRQTQDLDAIVDGVVAELMGSQADTQSGPTRIRTPGQWRVGAVTRIRTPDAPGAREADLTPQRRSDEPVTVRCRGRDIRGSFDGR